MIDFTNYNKYELEALLLTLIDDTTQAVTEEKDDGTTKTVVSPVFKTGIGFDTESTTIYTDDTHKTVKDCFCYSFQIAVGTKHYAIYRTLQQFVDFFHVLQDVIAYKNMDVESPAKCYIWVANLAHEWSFIKFRMMNEFGCTKMFAKSQRDCLYIEFGNIQFRECIGLFGHSLANIAKNWTTTQKLKGDLDYDKIRISTENYCTPLTETEKHYCINDVIILTEMHEAVTKAYLQENGALRLPYTSSGFVRMKLKELIRNDDDLTEERINTAERYKHPPKNNIELLKKLNKHIFVSPEQWTLCREYGYSGGLCGSNIDFVAADLKNITCADLTSDYPAQLLHEKYPSGWLKEYKPSYYSIAKKRKQPYFILAKVNFESKTNHATFSKHKIINYKDPAFQEKFGEPREMIVYNGKILKAKNCIVVMNDVDISAYMMIYKMKITVLKVWAFDRYAKIPEWLSNGIKDSYIKKAVLKHNGQQKTVAYRDSKRDVNSFYGILATRAQDSFDGFDDDVTSENVGLFKATNPKTIKQQFRECWLNPYIAFWCTSYARRILMYFISKYPDKIVQYDTDSLYYKPCPDLEKEIDRYNEKQYAINEKVFKDNENIDLLRDLGAWCYTDENGERETYEKFLAMGAKKYVKMHGGNVETVIAGLPKDAIPSEIAERGVESPLTYYNVVKKWIKEESNEIIISHMFAHKFASVYDDSPTEYKVQITDYLGNTAEQICGCYHAITPIDFTLSIAVDYLKHILHKD